MVKGKVLQWPTKCTTKTGYFCSADLFSILLHHFEGGIIHRWNIKGFKAIIDTCDTHETKLSMLTSARRWKWKLRDKKQETRLLIFRTVFGIINRLPQSWKHHKSLNTWDCSCQSKYLSLDKVVASIFRSFTPIRTRTFQRQ